MAEQSNHPSEQSADGWQVVDGLLDDLDRLSAKELAKQEFYAELAQRLAAIGCWATAVWTLPGGGSPKLDWRSAGLESRNGEVASTTQSKVLREVIEKG